MCDEDDPAFQDLVKSTYGSHSSGDGGINEEGEEDDAHTGEELNDEFDSMEDEENDVWLAAICSSTTQAGEVGAVYSSAQNTHYYVVATNIRANALVHYTVQGEEALRDCLDCLQVHCIAVMNEINF